MKKLLIILGFVSLPLIAYATTAFNSAQIGSNPVNGYVPQTNGSVTTWVATSSLGITGGGGSGTIGTSSSATAGYFPFWATPSTLTGTSSIFQSGVNVGIASTSPGAKLTVKGSGTGLGTAFQITDSLDSPKVTVLDNGKVGIGAISPATALEVKVASNVGQLTLTEGVNYPQTGIIPAPAILGRTLDNSETFRINADPWGNFNFSNGGLANLTIGSSGQQNFAFGFSTLPAMTSGSFNVAIGANVLHAFQSGNGNVGIGYTALTFNLTSSNNTGIGYAALFHTTGGGNTSLGYNSGNTLTSGIYNTFLGYGADVLAAASTTLTNATAIGYNSIVGASNSMVLGGTGAYAVNVGIGTTSPTNKLEVAGNGYLAGNLTTSSLVSTSTATSTFAGTVKVSAGSIINSEYTPATTTTMTIDWNQGTQQLVKLGHVAVTINFINDAAGQVLRLPLCQDSTGGATVTWDASVHWASSTAPTLSGANHCDLMTFMATAGTSTLFVMGGYALGF